MTSFKSRIDSFSAEERRSTLESRSALIWAIVVAVCYLLWNTPPPADRVTRFAIIFAVFGAIVLLVALWAAWRVRGVINRLRSLAPDDRDEVLGQHLTPEAREFYAKRLAAEGSIEFDGTVERFPFSPLDRRETLVLFWAASGYCIYRPRRRSGHRRSGAGLARGCSSDRHGCRCGHARSLSAGLPPFEAHRAFTPFGYWSAGC